MVNPRPGGFLKPKHPKVAVPEQPADPYADLYGYVTPPETTGLGGFVDQLKYINKTSPGAFMQLGAGLMGGDAAGGISNAAQALGQAQGDQRKLGVLARRDNMTRQWLIGQGFDEATADAAMANPEVLASLLKGGDVAKVFGNPIWGTVEETGETGLGTFDENGKFHLIDTPGFKPERGIKTVETATEILTINVSDGSIIARTPKDVAAGEEQKIVGKGSGEAKVLLKSMQSKMPGVEYVVKELESLANKATYTTTGKLIDTAMREAGQEPREAALARAEYINKVKVQILPILRDTFGAQFTVAEGQSLLATLGDPDAAPAEKQATLKAFIEQKRRDIEALAVETGQGGEKTYNPKTGKIE